MAGRGALRVAAVAFDLKSPGFAGDTYSMLRTFAPDVRHATAACSDTDSPQERVLRGNRGPRVGSSRRPNAAS